MGGVGIVCGDEVEVSEEIIKMVVDGIVGVSFMMGVHKILPLEMVGVLVERGLGIVGGGKSMCGAHRKYCFHYSTDHGIVKYVCVV